MTQSQLVVALYSRYEMMHQIWTSLAGSYGPGALMFFPEDYAKADTVQDIQWRFWKTSDVVMYLSKKLGGIEDSLRMELEEFTPATQAKFLAVVVTMEKLEGHPQVQVHFVPRIMLN